MKKKVEKMVGKTSKLAENQESASGVGTDQGAPGALKTEIREECGYRFGSPGGS
jgi:hypothetical protein